VNLEALTQAAKPLALLLLMPPLPFMVLLALGMALGRRWRRAGLAAVLLGLAGLWLSCCEGTGQWLAERLVRVPPPLQAAQIEALSEQQRTHGDVAVLVLGGGARQFVPEYNGPRLNDISGERLRLGLWLSRRTGAALGFSGGIGWQSKDLRQAEAEIAARSAEEDYGQPLRWTESRSRDTRENAQFSLELLREQGLRTLVLVTHDLHMPRAARAFRQAAVGSGLTIVEAPVGLRADAMSEISDWCPSSPGFARVRYAIYEWLGLLVGH